MLTKKSLQGLIISVALVFSLTAINTSSARTLTYTYDDLNRLERVEYDDGIVLDYYYDEVGNRTQRVETNLVVDSDSDDMPDYFEMQHNGLDPNNPDDAGENIDNDGLINLDEFLAGTDPTDPDTDDDYVEDGTDVCPVNRPVMISATSEEYASLQDAYNNSVNMDILKCHSVTLTEEINFNLNKTVSLLGGYDCDYTSAPGKTTISGNVTVGDGVITSIEKIIVD